MKKMHYSFLLFVLFCFSCTTAPKIQETISEDSFLSVRQEGYGPIVVTNLSPYDNVTVSTSFLGKIAIIGKINAGESLVHTPKWPGSTYRYSISTEAAQNITSVDFTGVIKASRTSWSMLETQAYQIKKVSIKNAELRISYLHGVKIVIALLPDAQKSASKEMKDAFEWQCLNSFHRLYNLFGGFPLTEYRIIVTDTVKTIESLPGCTATLRLFGTAPNKMRENINLSNEELSHQIGHAWIAGAIRDEYHTIDGWLTEGIDHFIGIAVLNTNFRYFSGDWREWKYIAHSNEPLFGMYQKYFGTSDSYSYYAKGSLLTGLILSELEKNGVDPLVFFRNLYKQYASVSLSNNINERSLISTNSLRDDLSKFGKISVEEVFDPYVFGNAVLSPDKVTFKFSSLSKAWE